MKDKILIGVKGFIVGGSMLVPGVSGGTMAMILNIYDQLISSVNEITRLKFKKVPFLLAFGIGAIVGFILLSKPLLALLARFENPMMFFFMGAVVGGLPLMFKEAKIKKMSISVPIYILIGFLIVYGISKIDESLLSVDLSAGFSGYVILFVAGIFISVALILPGISTSFMLLSLGILQPTLDALSNVYLPYLIPLGLGLLVGIVLTTGILEKAMKTRTTPTYLIIIGFVLGSVVEIIPGIPPLKELPICVALFLVAMIATNKMAALEGGK